MCSEKVLANWPAEMSHSLHGECDFDSERTDETPGSEQPAGRAYDSGSGGYTDGSEPTPHPAHTWRITGRTALHPLPMATGVGSRPTLFPRRPGAGWFTWLARCTREPTTLIYQNCSVNARASTWAGRGYGASWSTPGSAVRGEGARPSTGCAGSGCHGRAC